MTLVKKKSSNDRARIILMFGFCVSVLYWVAFTSVTRPRASSMYQVMSSITSERMLKAFEWLLFLALSGISLIFIKDCIVKFYSEDSTFKISEDYSIEHPTITVCILFNKQEENETFIDYKPLCLYYMQV